MGITIERSNKETRVKKIMEMSHFSLSFTLYTCMKERKKERKKTNKQTNKQTKEYTKEEK